MVTSSVSRRAGGLFFSVRRLGECISLLPGVTVEVHGVYDPETPADLESWRTLKPIVHRRSWPESLAYAPGLSAALLAADYHLLHTQGIWQWPSASVLRWHRKTGKPYVVSPRGMLDPWAVRQSRWKKTLASAWYEAEHLRNAACLHALCGAEADAFRAYGLVNSIAVVPNGVDLPNDVENSNGDNRFMLFLGRIHPKKGLANALRGWAAVRDNARRSNWRFIIAGWDQKEHEEELKRLVLECGLTCAKATVAELVEGNHTPSADILFVGQTFGAEKDQLLRAASAFILPSFSEGLPMSVLEAWAYRLPVLMTDHCNLPEGFAAGAAVRIGTDVESITDGLHEMISATNSQRQLMGDCGRALVERQFTWPQVAAQMKEVYDWVLGGGAKPSCVE
jgi:poly(glycerol-phosphate) alpha-glucosyltransferase